MKSKPSLEKEVNLQNDLSSVLHQLVIVDLKKNSHLYIDNFNPAIRSFAVGTQQRPPQQTKVQRANGPLRSVERLAGYVVDYTASVPDNREYDHLTIAPALPFECEPTHIACIEIPVYCIESCRRA